MPRGIYPRKPKRGRKPSSRIVYPSPFCVIGATLSPARATGKRTWFDDVDKASSHAANLLLSDMRNRDPIVNNTRELFVVQIIKVIRPKQPSAQFDFFDVETP